MSSQSKTIISPIVQHPLAAFVLILLLTLPLGMQATTMEFSTDLSDYLPETSGPAATLDAVLETWPFQTVTLVVEADNVTHPLVLTEIERIIDEINTYKTDDGTIDGVVASTDITYLLREINTQLRLEPAAADYGVTPVRQTTIDFYLTLIPDGYRNQLVSSDYRQALITLTTNVETVDSRLLAERIDSVTSTAVHSTVTASSQLFLEDSVEDLSLRYLELLIPIAALAATAILAIIFRSVKKTIIALLPPLFAAAQTLGIIALSGNDLDITMIAVGPLIIGFGVAYSIYLINRFSEERVRSPDAETAVTEGGTRMLIAIALSSITTIVGFLALTLSDMPTIARVGIACALGIALCLISVAVVVPSLLVLLRVDSTVNVADRKASQRRRRRAITKILSKPGTIAISAVIISLLAAANLPALESEFAYSDLIPQTASDGSPSSGAVQEAQFGFSPGDISFIMAAGDIRDPQTVRDIDVFAADIRAIDGVTYATSVASLVRNTQPDYLLFALISTLFIGEYVQLEADALPTTEDELERILDAIDENQLRLIVSEDYLHSLIAVGIDTTRPIEAIETTIAAVNAEAAGQSSTSSVEFSQITGPTILAVDIKEVLSDNQLTTALFSLVFVFIALLIFFRSPLFSVVTLVPTAAVVLWILGAMPALDITLNIATVMIASILMGAGIDFGIQITQRVRQEIGTGIDPREAVFIAVQNQGVAMIQTCLATVVGLSVALFIPIVAVRGFIALMALGLVSSCIAAVVVLPAAYLILIDAGFIRS